MKARLWGVLILALCWMVPTGGAAFSFLPGGFAPGEQILSIQLSAGLSGGPQLTFNGTTNTMTFLSAVSTITTNQDIYNIPLDDVVFSSSVTIVPGTEFVLAPVAPFSAGLTTAQLVNGLGVDLMIADIADGGNTLLAADYDTSILFNAGAAALGLPISGSMEGDFSLLPASDAGFAAAFGTAGNYFSNLSSFLSFGVPVGADLCVMIDAPILCSNGFPMTIDSFTVNPTTTIVPLAVPEPGALSFLGLAMLGLMIRRGSFPG
jgi:hypothetical protein